MFYATSEGHRQLEGKSRERPEKPIAIRYYFVHNFKDNCEITGSQDYSDSFFHAFFSVSNVITNKVQSLVRLIVFLTVSLILTQNTVSVINAS